MLFNVSPSPNNRCFLSIGILMTLFPKILKQSTSQSPHQPNKYHNTLTVCHTKRLYTKTSENNQLHPLKFIKL